MSPYWSARLTRLHLAASLGDEAARESLPPRARQSVDDAFAVLMSRSDVLEARRGLDFGAPRPWPYTLEAALRMAVAVFREFLPDWRRSFKECRGYIPKHIPAGFAPTVISIFSRWIVDPASFSWDEHETMYGWIKNDIYWDGDLSSYMPKVPVVGSYCYAAFWLTDVENCEPRAAPHRRTFNLRLRKRIYNPQGKDAARTADAIGWFLNAGLSPDRMRRACRREVVPWALGQSDPLASRVGHPKKQGADD